MKKRIRSRILIAAICLITMLGIGAAPGVSSALPFAAQSVYAADQRVTTTWLNLRKSDSPSGKLILSIPPNKKVTVLRKATGNWVRVKYGSRYGYVNSRYLKKAAIKATAVKKTMAENIKLRRTMKKINNSNVIAIIPKGAKVTILSKKTNNWLRVKWKNKTGYIKSGHFTDDKSRMGIGAVASTKKTVNCDLNFRSTMNKSISSNIICVIPSGKSVTLMSREANGWWRVKYAGKTGFIRDGHFK